MQLLLTTQNFRKPKTTSRGPDELDYKGRGMAHWCKGVFLPGEAALGEYTPWAGGLAWAPDRLQVLLATVPGHPWILHCQGSLCMMGPPLPHVMAIPGPAGPQDG